MDHARLPGMAAPQHRGRSASAGPSWPGTPPWCEAVYDLMFSSHCGFGAGTALYGTLCMLLGYRSQLYYRMNGGMGDVVFAPLYLWLRRRGVKFRFFRASASWASDDRRGADRADHPRAAGRSRRRGIRSPVRARGRPGLLAEPARWPSGCPRASAGGSSVSGCDLENGAETQGALAHRCGGVGTSTWPCSASRWACSRRSPSWPPSWPPPTRPSPRWSRASDGGAPGRSRSGPIRTRPPWAGTGGPACWGPTGDRSAPGPT